MIGNRRFGYLTDYEKGNAQIMYIFKAYPYLLRPCETESKVSSLSTFYYHYDYQTTREQEIQPITVEMNPVLQVRKAFSK